MNPSEARRREFLDIVVKHSDIACELRDELGSALANPSPDSIHAREWLGLAGLPDLEDAYVRAVRRITTLSELVASAVATPIRLVSEPVGVFPAWSAARAAIEAAGVVFWLLDPSIGQEERLMRFVGLDLRDLDEEVSLMSSYRAELARTDARSRELLERFDEARAERTALWQSWRRIGFRPRTVPNRSQLAHAVGLGSRYGLASGAAHGSMRVIEYLEDIRHDPEKLQRGRLIAEPFMVAASAQGALAWSVFGWVHAEGSVERVDRLKRWADSLGLRGITYPEVLDGRARWEQADT